MSSQYNSHMNITEKIMVDINERIDVFKVSMKTVSGQCESACERFNCGLAESGWEIIPKVCCAKSERALTRFKFNRWPMECDS